MSQKEVNKAIFDSSATTYDSDFTFSEIGKLQRNRVHVFLAKNILNQNKLSVLEINCGTGEDALWLAERGCDVIATDASSKMIEVVSLCDIKYERAEEQNKKYNVNAQTYPHIDKMLAGVPFDMMVTTTDMQAHGMLNKKAILAGKHVWSEKPMANTYAEGKALLDLAKSKKLRLWGAPAVVNSPQFAFMSRTIQEGKLGRIASAHGQYGHTGPTWSAFFYEKGGGSMPDLGVYNMATLTGLLGPARSVMAMTSIVNPERTVDDKGKIKVMAEDNAHVLLEHDKGVISHVMCGFNYFDPHGMKPAHKHYTLFRFMATMAICDWWVMIGKQMACGLIHLGTNLPN